MNPRRAARRSRQRRVAVPDSAETIRRQHAALVAREKALLEFIENTTHDLATPLTVLQGNLSALAKDEVVSRVVDRHRAMAKWLGVEIERAIPEEQVLALGDPTFTERALANLVENATRHNVSGGHVAVVLETEGGEFVLRVLDDGPGLTQVECERALRWDERRDAARSRTSAGGLGLSIVARVAQIQRWRFALTPGESGGLVAELRGPVA